MTLYYAQPAEQSTGSGTFVPIPGLTVTIPEGVGDTALVIVNLPNPYADGKQ